MTYELAHLRAEQTRRSEKASGRGEPHALRGLADYKRPSVWGPLVHVGDERMSVRGPLLAQAGMRCGNERRRVSLGGGVGVVRS